MLEDVSSTDSNKTDMLTQLVNNFDAADSDGDGKVTREEAQSYYESTTSNTILHNADTAWLSNS